MNSAVHIFLHKFMSKLTADQVLLRHRKFVVPEGEDLPLGR